MKIFNIPIDQVLPPILYHPVRALYKKHICKETGLFDGQAALFHEKIFDAKIYGEYGAGDSTRWVLENTDCKILSVDTSKDWITHVESFLNGDSRVDLQWADVGEIKGWGYPISYQKKNVFIDYVESIWRRDLTPDLVLVDGRFRVACFLTCLLEGPVGTGIIFDDYTNRPRYHIVEEFVKPKQIYERQAYFEIPENLDHEKIKKMRVHFLYVMD